VIIFSGFMIVRLIPDSLNVILMSAPHQGERKKFNPRGTGRRSDCSRGGGPSMSPDPVFEPQSRLDARAQFDPDSCLLMSTIRAT
jgi:hypothetical protein